MRAVGWFQIVVGAGIVTIWPVLLLAGEVPAESREWVPAVGLVVVAAVAVWAFTVLARVPAGEAGRGGR